MVYVTRPPFLTVGPPPNSGNQRLDQWLRTLYDQFRRLNDAHFNGGWNDLTPEPHLQGVGTDPAWDTTVGGYLFDGNTSKEYLAYTLQLPHHWAEGTTLVPHVHWTKTTSATATTTTNVMWELAYRWAPIGEVFDGTWTTLSAATTVAGTPDSNAQDVHLITELGEIDSSGKGISDMLLLLLDREPNDAADTYGSDARLLSFDLHAQIDSAGSDRPYNK